MGKFVEKPYPIRHLPDIRDLIRYDNEHFADQVAYEDRHVPGNPERRKITYAELYKDVNALGTALIHRGLKDKKIAVMSENRYDWVLSYYAVACGVGVIIPLDRELPPAEVVNLLTRAKASALIYSKKQKKTVEAAVSQLSFVEYLIDMDEGDHQWRNLSLQALLEEGRELLEQGDHSYLDAEIDPNGLMGIYFTSGTTGRSKGVMLSHRNITANVENMLRRMHIDTNSKILSVMPIHHTFEFTCSIITCLSQGSTVCFADGLKYIQKNLKEDHPTVMLGVPLVFETFHKRIMTAARLGGKEEQLKKGMKLNNFLQKIHLDRSRQLFKDIYEIIGTSIQVFIVGGAPMDPQIIRDFRTLGVNMFEGYGLTETAPIIAMNADYREKPGAAGAPLHGTEVRIDDPDEAGVGEILAKTESRMLGYFEDPEETDKVLLPDGWFATGDYGYMDEEGFLHVTGRKKNVIVTKNGKNIFPEELEYLLNKSDYIKESVVWGDEDEKLGDLIITAEIVTEPDQIKGLSEEEVREIIKNIVEEVNQSTTSYKRIRKFNLRKEEFEKTTTRKIKRHNLDLKSQGEEAKVNG